MSIKKRIENIETVERKLIAKKAILVNQAMHSSNPSDLIKANNILNVENREDINKKSYIVDPYEFQNFMGYKDKPFSVSYSMARRISYTAPIIRSIINTRIEQVLAFCEPQETKYDAGFIIKKKTGFYDKETKEMTKEDMMRAERITQFLLDGGLNNKFDGDDFDSFVRKFLNDSLTFDQGCFEVVHDRKGRPVEFFAVDGGTIRIADSIDKELYENDDRFRDRIEVMGYYPSYCQIKDSAITADYYPWEMCFGIRNPTTNIYSNGYGVSEIEMMTQIITSMLYSDEYNRRFFMQGSAPKGFFKIKPGTSISDDKLSQFKQMWQGMMSGVYNTHKTPILEGDIDWVDLQKNNRDMEFSNWQEYLIKLSCAIYRIDPAEINFPLSGGADQKAMFEGNNEARLKHSKDKGLLPLLKFLERKINKFIIQRIDPEFVFKFCGLGVESAKDELEDDIKLMNFMTVDEIRIKRGLKPVGEEKGGNTIANSIVAQGLMAKQQSEQAEQGGMGGGQQGGGEEDQYQQGEEDDQSQQEADTDFSVNEEGQGQEENPFEKAFQNYLNKI